MTTMQRCFRCLAGSTAISVLFTFVANAAVEHPLFLEDRERSLEVGEIESPGAEFPPIVRQRRTSINPSLTTAAAASAGDRLSATLFDGETILAVIDRVSVDVNGVVLVRARPEAYDLGLIVLSTDGQHSLGTISLPEKNEQYLVRSDAGPDATVLYQIDVANISRPPHAPSLVPPPLSPEEESARRMAMPRSNPSASANIDLLVVYTPAAKTWATAYNGGISNVISQAMDRGQDAFDRSNVIATITLAHSAEINYQESGNAYTDLDRLTFVDGFMDEVHTLRNTHYADLVLLLVDINDTGGLGWILNTTAGTPDYGFCLADVKLASWTYTCIHEIGHNLGCEHRKNQATEPWTGILFPYAAGWTWTGNDMGSYCSVMSYEDYGQITVPHFSNPNIFHKTAATGHAADGDNARAIRETKHVAAAYRTAPGACTAALTSPAANAQLSFPQTFNWTISGACGNVVLLFNKTNSCANAWTTNVNGSSQRSISATEWSQIKSALGNASTYYWALAVKSGTVCTPISLFRPFSVPAPCSAALGAPFHNASITFPQTFSWTTDGACGPLALAFSKTQTCTNSWLEPIPTGASQLSVSAAKWASIQNSLGASNVYYWTVGVASGGNTCDMLAPFRLFSLSSDEPTTCTATLAAPAANASVSFPADFSWNQSGACANVRLVFSMDSAGVYNLSLPVAESPTTITSAQWSQIEAGLGVQGTYYWGIGILTPANLTQVLTPMRAITLSGSSGPCTGVLVSPAPDETATLPITFAWTVSGSCANLLLAFSRTAAIDEQGAYIQANGLTRIAIDSYKWREITSKLGAQEVYYWNVGTLNTGTNTFTPLAAWRAISATEAKETSEKPQETSEEGEDEEENAARCGCGPRSLKKLGMDYFLVGLAVMLLLALRARRP